MRTLVFPFTTQDIILTTPDELSDERWEKISKEVGNLITSVLLTLHPTEPDSPIAKLHESGIGFPVQANDILWEFLQIAEHYSELSGGKLNIISGGEYSGVIDFNAEELTISRNADVQIKPHVIMNQFTINMIDKLLQSSELNNYLISSPHSYLVRGAEQWEITFLHPDTEGDIDMVVSEGAAVITYPSRQQSGLFNDGKRSTEGSPFSGTVTPLNPISAAVIESGDPLYSRAIGEFIFDLQVEYQFKKFVNEWKCGATLLYADGSYKQYSPNVG